MSYKTNPKVYMDVQIGASEAGRIIFELFTDLTPKTVENFRGLCTGQYGKPSGVDVRLHYLNSKFHRIVDNFVIQGGDITGGGGTGGYSIYGRTFLDENFARRHSCAGLLSMANCGRNSNSSQFFITLKACPHLDGKHVVFGQVIDGMETVRKMSKVPVDKMDKPKIPIIILDCGEVGDFKAFLRYDPFKKSVIDQILDKKRKIIEERHKIRKLLEQGIDPNAAYDNKTKLEKCEQELREIEQQQQKYLEAHPQQAPSKKLKPQDQQPVIPQPQPIGEALKNTLKPKQLDRLMEMKIKLNEARALNSKAVLFEEMQQNDINYHKAMKKEEWLEKRKLLEEELKAKGIKEDKLYLNRTSAQKQESDGKDTSGWGVFTQEALYKAYYKRCSQHPVNKQVYDKKKEQPDADGKPTEQALNRLAADVEKQIEKRGKFNRSRLPVEDEVVTYVNERNRVYNNKLDRAFGKYSQNIKTALQMASQRQTK